MNQPDDAEVYFSVWSGRYGEKRYRCNQLSQENALSKNGKFLRLSWADDCQMDRISEVEFKV